MLPDIDYFEVFTLGLLHGERERSKRSYWKRRVRNLFGNLNGYKPSKLGNFAGENDWILIGKSVSAPEQLIQSVPPTLSS